MHFHGPTNSAAYKDFNQSEWLVETINQSQNRAWLFEPGKKFRESLKR